MNQDLPTESKKVQTWLKNRGFDNQVIILDRNASSAKEAAEVLGCKIEHIAKSLIFKTVKTNRPILTIVSGMNKIDMTKLFKVVGEMIEKPDAEFVKETSGFSIGGVPPVGHRNKFEVYVDEDIKNLSFVWTAAGHPKAVFKIKPEELIEMTQGKVVDIKV